MMRTGIACAGALVAASAASADFDMVMTETEPNDTLADANFTDVLDFPGGSILVDLNIEPGDVDWFEFEVSDFATLLISQVGSPDDPTPDLQLQLVDGSGTVIEFDDDDGPGLLPAINVPALPAGTYFIGVSGFPDGNADPSQLFDGLDSAGLPHQQSGAGKLSIDANVIPAPGAVTLAGLAGLAALRRRR